MSAKKTHSMIFITALFIGLILFVVAYVTYSFDAQGPETYAGADADNKTDIDQDSGSHIAGWKAYYNEGYKFSIDYPGDWKVQETKYEDLSTHSVYFGEPVNGYFPVMINFYKKPSDIAFEDWIENNTYLSGTFQRGFVESKGALSNYYIDKTMAGGAPAYKVTLLSDTYFFPKVFKGKLDDYYSRCKCDYDAESIYLLKGDAIIGVTHINNMNGKKTSNNLAEKDGRYEVESTDADYIASKDMFLKMINSFTFAEK